MTPNKRILAINGSYRPGGITDQAVEAAASAIRAAGGEVETVTLRDYPIEFCLNCRECTQAPGEQPGHCVQDDGMAELIQKIEAADGYILASPTNFGTVTATFKRFMERLIVYADWPWGQPGPQTRTAKRAPKPALLISSSGAPGLLGRWVYDTPKRLKQTARTIGAKPVGILFTGLAARGPNLALPERSRIRARKLAERLVAP